MKYAVVFILGVILLSGCTSNNSDVVVDDDLVEENDDLLVSDFEFTVPLELPIAYVGVPYIYSFCSPDPIPMPEDYYQDSICGVNVTEINPKGGVPPYDFSVHNEFSHWYVKGLYNEGDGVLNFTANPGEEGQYVLEVCVNYNDEHYDYVEVCKNTTIYIMSDVVTVKGEGELSHALYFSLDSDTSARDYAQNYDDKEISFDFVPTANFSSFSLTSQVPASPVGAYWEGGGSSASLNVNADASSVTEVAQGNAACGHQTSSEPALHQVDYYHVGFVGYDDNIYIELDVTNTGTKSKAVDIILNISSEIDAGSQTYFDASANAQACVGYQHCIESESKNPGELSVNSTVYRVIIKAGHHRIYVANMNNRVDNTNMARCPSFVKSTSSVSVNVVPRDMNDGIKAIGSISTDKYGESDVNTYANIYSKMI